MKIAIVSQPTDTVKPPADGGGSIEILTHNFATLLAERGHDVTVYALAMDKTQKRQSNRINGEINYRLVFIQTRSWFYRINARVMRQMFSIVRPSFPFVASVLYHPAFAIRVALDVRRRRVEITHIHNFSQYVSIIKAICPSTKIVLHMHCRWLVDLPRQTIQKHVGKCAAIICCSDFITQSHWQIFGGSRSKSQTIYNGVDVGRFDGRLVKAGSQDVYFIGEVSPHKGVHILIDAFKRVSREVPRSRLFLIGALRAMSRPIYQTFGDDPILKKYAGPFYDRCEVPRYPEILRAEVAEHLDGRVHFCGHLSHTELIERLRSAALVVQPSLCGEPFGMPVAEAMAMGLPVVVARGGALPEVVEDGVTGLVVERGSSAELAEAIIELLRQSERRRAMGAAARRRAVERFSFQQMTKQLEEQYHALL
jgi:glycosyltransferase involved in cell wall biosynthesis